MSSHSAFAVPAFVSADFAAIRGYWNSLKRGGATIPFTDDLKLSALGRLADLAALIQVFERPQRFRFISSGRKLVRWHGSELDDRFADELTPRAPLDCLVSQASATVEIGAATFYRHVTDSTPDYQRLMLPMWGEGHSNAILCAFEAVSAAAAS